MRLHIVLNTSKDVVPYQAEWNDILLVLRIVKILLWFFGFEMSTQFSKICLACVTCARYLFDKRSIDELNWPKNQADIISEPLSHQR